MAFTAGSRVSFSYIRENDFGVTPATPAMTRIPITNTSLNLNKEELTSSELRSDRQISTARHGNRSVGGDLGVEVRIGSIDDFLAAALAGTWTTTATTPPPTVSELEVGVQQTTFTMEIGHTDNNLYRLYTGCAISTFGLSVAPNAMITATFGITGRDMAMNTATTAASSTEPTMSEVVDSFSGTLEEGGVTIATATGLELNLDNGLVATQVIGSPVTPQLVWGRSNLTGTLSAYVESTSLFNKFINETHSSLRFRLTSGGSSLEFFLPKVLYTGSSLDVADEGPIVAQLPFRALLDTTTENTNLRVTRSVA